jgi:hypothetical protein
MRKISIPAGEKIDRDMNPLNNALNTGIIERQRTDPAQEFSVFRHH